MKIEIEDRITRFIARITENGKYIREYGSPVIFRAKTKKRVIELAEHWIATKQD